MSFKSREKKRKAEDRDGHARGKTDRHYLTPVSRHCSCNACGTSLRAGRGRRAYRHSPREILIDEPARERLQSLVKSRNDQYVRIADTS